MDVLLDVALMVLGNPDFTNLVMLANVTVQNATEGVIEDDLVCRLRGGGKIPKWFPRVDREDVLSSLRNKRIDLYRKYKANRAYRHYVDDYYRKNHYDKYLNTPFENRMVYRALHDKNIKAALPAVGFGIGLAANVQNRVRGYEKYIGAAALAGAAAYNLRSRKGPGMPGKKRRYHEMREQATKPPKALTSGRINRLRLTSKNYVSRFQMFKFYYTLNFYDASAYPSVFSGTSVANDGLPATSTYFHYYRQAGYGPLLFHEMCQDVTGFAGGADWDYGEIVPYLTARPKSGTVEFNPARMPINASLYLFDANWPFQTMIPIPECRVLANQDSYLAWVQDNQNVTTDPSFPIRYDIINENKDWTKMQIYGTRHYVTFTNSSPVAFGVEVLFFTLKVDVDELTDFKQWASLPLSQGDDYESYYRKKWISGYGTPQINVVKRDRFVLPTRFKSVSSSGTTNVMLYNSTGYGMKTRTYDIKEKYCMKRAIPRVGDTFGSETPTYPNYTEPEFYDKFRDTHKAVYCRVAAWPMIAMDTISSNISTTAAFGYASNVTKMNGSVMCYLLGPGSPAIIANPNTTSEAGRCGVSFSWTKRTFFKCDTEFMKGPFIS